MPRRRGNNKGGEAAADVTKVIVVDFAALFDLLARSVPEQKRIYPACKLHLVRISSAFIALYLFIILNLRNRPMYT